MSDSCKDKLISDSCSIKPIQSNGIIKDVTVKLAEQFTCPTGELLQHTNGTAIKSLTCAGKNINESMKLASVQDPL